MKFNHMVAVMMRYSFNVNNIQTTACEIAELGRIGTVNKLRKRMVMKNASLLCKGW